MYCKMQCSNVFYLNGIRAACPPLRPLWRDRALDLSPYSIFAGARRPGGGTRAVGTLAESRAVEHHVRHVVVRSATIKLARQLLAATLCHLVVVEAYPNIVLVLHPSDIVPTVGVLPLVSQDCDQLVPAGFVLRQLWVLERRQLFH